MNIHRYTVTPFSNPDDGEPSVAFHPRPDGDWCYYREARDAYRKLQIEMSRIIDVGTTAFINGKNEQITQLEARIKELEAKHG